MTFSFTGCRDLALEANGCLNYGGTYFLGCKRVRITDTRCFDSNTSARRKPHSQTDIYAYVFGRGEAHNEDIEIRNNVIEDLQLEVDYCRRVKITHNLVVRPAHTAGIGTFSLQWNAVAGLDSCGEDILIADNTLCDLSDVYTGIAVHLDPAVHKDGSPLKDIVYRNVRIFRNKTLYADGDPELTLVRVYAQGTRYREHQNRAFPYQTPWPRWSPQAQGAGRPGKLFSSCAIHAFPDGNPGRGSTPMKHACLLAGLGLSLLAANPSARVSHRAAAALPRSAPEAQGVDSSGIRAFIEAADRQVNTMHSVMIVRHGKVIAEGWWKPNSPETPHVLWSLSKSFTSTAVGFAISEGKLSLDDEVLKFFPEDAPAQPSVNLKAMRVRDLLIMSTGNQTEPPSSDAMAWTKAFLAHPVPYKPGTHFLYNSHGTYMLSAIVQKVTGQTVRDYLRPRLFEPLGIEDPTWDMSPQGINLGGWGLYLRTEDIAKFGQCYLQKGRWHGKHVIPEAWVAAATARQTSNGSNPNSDWDQGYGYQFWRCRHGAFRGDGANGQFCIVMPEQDMVVAITADTRDMQAVLNLVWDKLLPAVRRSRLPANQTAQSDLEQILSRLAVRPKTS